MSTSIKRVFILFMAFAMVIMFMPETAVHAAGKSKTKATVSTQKQLSKALKTKRIKTITISTSKKKSITIPKGNYKSKKITVKGKKLTVVNKGKTGRITVYSVTKFTQAGSSTNITDTADDSYLVLNKGSDTDTVKTSGEDMRIVDNASTDIKSTNSATTIVGNGAEGTTVDLDGDGTQSSVINNGDEEIKLDVDKDRNNLPPGDIYTGNKGDNSNVQVNDTNPLKNFCGLVKSGSLSLDIHGFGKLATMSTDDKIHGWYHNMATQTDYECYFFLDGNDITAERIENANFEKNYKGDATFAIVAMDSTSMTIKSTTDIYGDNGSEYQFYYDAGFDAASDSTAGVAADNPLKIFSGGISSYPLNLEIHGSGVLSNMSHGNRIHGWYNNKTTATAYECNYIVDGNKVKAELIENVNYNKNYLGDAEFEITDSTDKYVTMRSINNVYGDEGTSYTFRTWDSSDWSGPVAADNPLKIFSDLTKSGDLGLDIHGCGMFSDISHGYRTHGWYHNYATGTDYETWMLVDGDTIHCTYIENTTHEKNYKGDAEFKIINSDSTHITVQSSNDVYGDIGTEYIFVTKGIDPAVVDENNPLRIFSGPTVCDNLRLEIHGLGSESYPNGGYKVHGWYHNKSTGTAYQCFYIVVGNIMTVEHIDEYNKHQKNYLGDAKFEIISSTLESITVKSINNIYGDEGTVYTFDINNN